MKVIYVSANKATINKAIQLTDDTKASCVTSIGTSIANVAAIKPKENIIIVNMEEKTTITTIVNQKVYNIEKIDEGSEEILRKISMKENSYSKAMKYAKILQFIQWILKNYKNVKMNILMKLCLHCIK